LTKLQRWKMRNERMKGPAEFELGGYRIAFHLKSPEN